MSMPDPDDALKGRPEQMPLSEKHFVLGNPLRGPVPEGHEVAVFGNGCFWGTEKMFWRLPGVYTTSVGYIAGYTPNPTYEEVCSGATGHNEAVRVVYDPTVISFADLLKPFWESHNPTQGMRQGNDAGTQYRSGIYVTTEDQRVLAEASLASFQEALRAAGEDAKITTEIKTGETFYWAEQYHQQYLNRPGNRQYCGADPTGAALPTPDKWPLPQGAPVPKTNPSVWAEAYAGCVIGR